MRELWAWLFVGGTVLAATELLVLEWHRRTFVPGTRQRRLLPWPRQRKSHPPAPTLEPATNVPAYASVLPRRRRHAVHYLLGAMRTQHVSARPARESANVQASVRSSPDSAAPTATEIDTSGRQRPAAGEPSRGAQAEAAGVAALLSPRTVRADEGIVHVDVTGRFTFATQTARDLLCWQTGDLGLGDVLTGGAEQSAALLDSVARQEVVDAPVTLLAGGLPQRFEISALALRDRNGNMWGAALFIRPSGTVPAGRFASPTGRR